MSTTDVIDYVHQSLFSAKFMLIVPWVRNFKPSSGFIFLSALARLVLLLGHLYILIYIRPEDLVHSFFGRVLQSNFNVDLLCQILLIFCLISGVKTFYYVLKELERTNHYILLLKPSPLLKYDPSKMLRPECFWISFSLFATLVRFTTQTTFLSLFDNALDTLITYFYYFIFHLHILVIKTLTSIILTQTTNLITLIERSPDEKIVEESMKLYMQLHKISQILRNGVGNILFILISVIFFHSVSILYYVVLSNYYIVQNSLTLCVMSVSMFFMWIYNLFTIAECGQSLKTKSEEVYFTLMRRKMKDELSLSFLLNRKLLSCLHFQRIMHFSANGFFHVDYNMLLTRKLLSCLHFQRIMHFSANGFFHVDYNMLLTIVSFGLACLGILLQYESLEKILKEAFLDDGDQLSYKI